MSQFVDFHISSRWANLSKKYRKKHPLCEHEVKYGQDRRLWGCRAAGLVTKATQVDHVDPQGPRWDESNLQSICTRCHQWKTLTEFGQPIVELDSRGRRIR